MCNILVLYVKIETEQWFKFTTSDGVNIVELLKEEPKILELSQIKDEFAYPVKSLFENYYSERICAIKQYMPKNKTDELNGFYFEFEEKMVLHYSVKMNVWLS